ncbi:MAG TPA: signal peptidase II [Gemmatimonadaceae bacterium]|jgi:signal peptidase II|nr:signal peptidase II [Gemmatimonadaceae bacterium]
MERSSLKAPLFWSLIVGIVALDVVTKLIAVDALRPMRVPREVVGEWVRLTLVYNRGAAFGLHLGPYSRWIFLLLTIIALIILGRLYRAAREKDTLRITALGLVCAGAVGNLIDRIRSPLGVVDFLDMGFGDLRWPTFNVADIAVSFGAILLAWSLWGEEREEAARASPSAVKASEGA